MLQCKWGIEYMEEEAALLCSSKVMLSEDHELTHDIRLELNAVKRCLLSIMRKQEIMVLPQPMGEIYSQYTPSSRMVSSAFDSFVKRASVSSLDRAGPGMGQDTTATVGHANPALSMSALSQSARERPSVV